MSYNEEEIADTSFCIEWLNQKYGVDLDSHLTAEEKAVSTAFHKLVEDDLYW